MLRTGLAQTLDSLKKKLGSIESRAKMISTQFEMLRREAESFKIECLQHYLEEQRKDIARSRGLISLVRDKKRIRDSLLMAAGGFILGGLLTSDKFEALTAGMSGFNGMVQGFGECKWCVILGKEISIVPAEMISPEVTWTTLDSFYKTMEELKKRALAGEKLGSLDDVINKLKTNYG